MTVAVAALTGGQYQRLLGPSNGTDDTVWLNQALAAGGVFRAMPGVEYKINDPGLIVPTETTLISDPSTTYRALSTLTTNLLSNRSPKYPAANNEDAPATAGSKVIPFPGPATTTGAFAVGQTAVIATAGSIDGTVPRPHVSQITAVTSGSITIADAALSTTPAYSATAYTRETNIRVVGGRWIRGANGFSGKAVNGNIAGAHCRGPVARGARQGVCRSGS